MFRNLHTQCIVKIRLPLSKGTEHGHKFWNNIGNEFSISKKFWAMCGFSYQIFIYEGLYAEVIQSKESLYLHTRATDALHYGVLKQNGTYYFLADEVTQKLAARHGHRDPKLDPGSDPMDLDLRSYGIIDPTYIFCREILWDHRSTL